jgi:biotin transport system substrate-specific component
MTLSARSMALTALFAALTALGAFLAIPIGPVSITLQTLFVLLAGILLGARLGALSQLIYIALGLFGLPVFSGFTGGLSSVFKPSFGFLIGFIVAAYLVGFLAEKYLYQSAKPDSLHSPSKRSIFFFKILLIAFAGSFFIYLLGIPYMYIILHQVMHTEITFCGAVKAGYLVFLPGDILKALLASLLGMKILPKIKQR